VRHPNLATREHSGLLVIDVQQSLLNVVQDGEAVVAAARLLLRAGAILDVPSLGTTQYAERLGPVVPQIAELLTHAPLDKMAFSCCGSPAFLEALNATHRRVWVLCGLEAHICVAQTALDLLHRGHRVHVVADGVSARALLNCEIGLRKVEDAGAVVTSAEAVIYEWLGEAGTPEFREILELIRRHK
jgi:isochorismatase family protein